MKQTYILAARTDGFGSRLMAFLNALFLAKELGNTAYAKLYYPNRGLEYSLKEYEQNKIVRGSVDKIEKIFSQDFIKKHCITEIKGEVLELRQCKSMQELKEIFMSAKFEYIEVDIGFLYWYFKDLSHKFYKKTISELFYALDFTQNIKDTIKEALEKAQALKNYDSVHYRSGDVIYRYTDISRLTGDKLAYFASYFELVFALAQRIKQEKRKVLIVGDDHSAIASLRAKDVDILLVSDYRSIEKKSNIELFIFDVIMLSKAHILYSTGSALGKIALLLNENLRFFHSYFVFSRKKRYELSLFYHHLNDLSNDQKAYSLFHLYLLEKDFDFDLTKSLNYLYSALSLDYENDKYRIYILYTLCYHKKFKEAEDFAQAVLEFREKSFFQTLFSVHFKAKVYEEALNLFLNLRKGFKYPYLYSIALECAKLDKNPLKNKEFDFEFERNSAVVRVQKSLSYQIGKALISSSHSFSAYCKLPFVLFALKKSFEQKLKDNQKDLKHSSFFATAPSKYLPDYEQSLRFKEHLSYRLGLAFIKAYKNKWGGGVVEILFHRFT